MPVCCLSWLMKSSARDFVMYAMTRSMEAKDSDLFTSASDDIAFEVDSQVDHVAGEDHVFGSPDEPSEIGFRARAQGVERSVMLPSRNSSTTPRTPAE